MADKKSKEGVRTFVFVPGSVQPKSNSTEITSLPKKSHYEGKTPMQAAKKAFTQLSKIANQPCSYTFSIKETKGAERIFTYYGVKEMMENGKYKTTVRSHRENNSKPQILRTTVEDYSSSGEDTPALPIKKKTIPPFAED